MSGKKPDGWRTGNLGDLILLEYGKSLPEAKRVPGPFPVYGSSGIVGFNERALVSAPGIIIGRKGTVGSVTFAESDFWPIDTTYFVSRKGDVDLRWIYYLLQHLDLAKLNEATGVPGLNRDKAAKVSVVIPSLPEQRRIAEILSSVDEAIQATQAVIEQTRKVKQGVLNRLLTKGIDHTRFKLTEIGEIPEGWTVKRLEDVCSLSGGAGFPIKYQGHQDLAFPFVKVSDMNLSGNEQFITAWNNTIDETIAKALRARPFPEGAIIFPKVGAALLTNKRRILTRPTFVDNNIMVAIPHQSMVSEFVYHFLCEVDFSKHVQSGAVPSINQATVGNILIPVPPLTEQGEIANALRAIDQTCEQLLQEETEYEALKGALMSDLLTGRKRVTTDLPMAAE